MQHALTFWTNSVRLARYPKTTIRDVDIPLPAAAALAKWAVSWTVALTWLTVVVCQAHAINHWFLPLIGRHDAQTVTLLLFAGCGVIAMPITYGFLRLYTLLTHVLTLNLFKTRGQRLRLLNFETRLLSLTPAFCVCTICTRYLPTLGLLLFVVVGVGAVWLLAIGYNHIFHKQSVGGLALWLGGTLVTWFVLFIGALAITVMVSVLAFFVILILRSFMRG